MSAKIKFSFIKMFFRLFSFLADKTGGWKIFVQPKIMLGTMIIGFGVVACNSAEKAKSNNETIVADTTKIAQDIDTVIADTAKIEVTNKRKKATVKQKPYDSIIACYACYVPLEEPIYEYVEKKAEFRGGEKELYRWLKENLKYPFIAEANNIEGRVYVNFVVRPDGKIVNVQIEKGVHSLLDDEAIRLVKSMPRWKPAQKEGKNVSVSFTLPIYFVLKN